MQKPVLRVLLVDDDEEALILLQGCTSEIKSTRFQIDYVASVEEARNLITEKAYDVFLVDYFIGREEGSTLIREAKGLGITTPIVMLTGMAVPAADRECMELGAAAFLNKDYLFADILERTIRYAIQRQRLEETLSKKAALTERCKILTELSQKIAPRIQEIYDLGHSISMTNLDESQRTLITKLLENVSALLEISEQIHSTPMIEAHAA